MGNVFVAMKSRAIMAMEAHKSRMMDTFRSGIPERNINIKPRSKYKPHQGKQERNRRKRQGLAV